MGLSGNLQTMSVGDLLQWLSLARKTGTLVVSRGGVEKKIFFRKGQLISSASNDPREYLGQFLMSHGYITEDELNKAMEVQRESHILLGKILVTIKAIEQKDLVRLMRLKAEEEIYDIFVWPDGDFHFFDDELPTMQMIPLQVDITGIIMEGGRRADEWPVIRKVIPDGAHTPVVEKPIDVATLSEAKKMIVQAINGHRTVDEIVLESRSSSFNVARTLYELVSSKTVRLIAPRKKVEAEPAPKQKFLTTDDEVAGLLARAQSALRAGDYERSLRSLRAASDLDPDNGMVRNALKGAETVIAQELRKEGIVTTRIPRLVRELQEMTDMNFSANEGFILSRINGTWDIGSIVRISPMREADALLIFYQLVRKEVVELSPER